MEFEWDDEKNKSNLEKHGIAFEEAALIFSGVTLSKTDDRRNYGEVRTISIGQLVDQVVVVVVHTLRDHRIRMISARLAHRIERKEYHEYCSQIT